MRHLSLIGMICSWLAILPVSASENPPLTVDQLVEQALNQNAELRFYEAEVAAAKGQRTQAGLWKNPEVSGEFGQRRIKDGDGILQNEGYTSSVSITQTFEFPGKGSLRKAIANKNIELAELGLKQFRWVLEGQVRSLALQYTMAAANADAAAEISERSSGLIKLLQERPSSGSTQLLELRVIEGNLLELRKSAQESILAREEARLELNTLLGWPSSQSLKITPSLTLPKLNVQDLNQLILAGLSNNLQLRVRQVELEKAVKEVSAAKLDIAPDFSVGPFFSQDKAGETEENIGGTLSMTIPLWDWNQGNIATSKARQAQADAMLLDARRKVESEISRRYRAYQLNRDLINQMPDNAVTNLREASDLADRQYRTGAVGVQLFLEVQREFLNSQKTRNEAILDTWKNWLDLELLTGGTAAAAAVNIQTETKK